MLKIVSINNEGDICYPQHLLCDLKIKSEKLKQIFGDPIRKFDGKTDWEWVIKFENNEVLYIYDYKLPCCPNCSSCNISYRSYSSGNSS